MNLVKCANGHFYDESRYDKCPHCSGGAIRNDNVTVPILQNAGSDAVTTNLSAVPAATAPVQSVSLQDAVQSAVGNAPVAASKAGDDQQTVSFYKKTIGSEPVVGWLVCVEGAHFGEDFRLKSGRNFIGRGGNMDVVIANDSAVSRERHAAVVYEPKGHTFLVMPGESKELCYLNDEVVLTPKEIKVNDKLTVGDSKLMFIPCCGLAFNWDMAKKEEK